MLLLVVTALAGAALAQAPAAPDDGPAPSRRLAAEDLEYRGAFRLPGESGGSSWEYGGNALAYYPGGDPEGADDGYPGSLFGIGHDHHQRVSEITIPAPARVGEEGLKGLATAGTLQPFADIKGDSFGELELPCAGLAYLPPREGETTGKLHFTWGQHFQWEPQPTHGWCELDLQHPRRAGPWRLGDWSPYVTDRYLFPIDPAWAASHTPGCSLATGRFREGSWGGLGPALLAYGPPPPGGEAPESAVKVTPLLLYGTPQPGSPELATTPERRMRSYATPDDWSAGAWLTAGDRSAVALVGTKALGRTWYGFANGVEYPTDPDATEFPEVPEWPNDSRGYWAEEFRGWMLLYDPADLARVAAGKLQPWEPQPYAEIDLSPHLLGEPRPLWDGRYLMGGAAFDRERGLLYVVQRRADEDRSVIHVWRVR